jgi:hypothetical protein
MVSQNVTRKWESVYGTKKKKQKKKEGSAPINWANIDANIPIVSNTKTTSKQKGSKNNDVSQKNANHSSGCWYPHPCSLRCLLLGETWACGQATITQAKKTKRNFPILSLWYNFVPTRFSKNSYLPIIASGISAARIYCVHMLLLPFARVEMTHGATLGPELMTSLISFWTQF